MAITRLKIHPAIGVARLGNTPDEFFVGPERLWDPPDPPGGFRDADGRVKRQAARFRVFAYHDDGAVKELTAAEATITWTVQLANKKAVTRNVDGECFGATCTPSQPGQYAVTATVFSGDTEVRGEAMLVVEPQPKPLARLQLEPAQATIALGASETYTARGVAEDGTDLGDYTATASFATSSDDGCFGASCTPSQPGQHTVTASVFIGDTEIRGEALLMVEPQPRPLARLQLEPTQAQVLLGASQNYTVRGMAEDGTDLGDYTATASFAISSEDDCFGASCTPSEPGRHTVTATVFAGDSEVRGEAVLVVEPQPAPLARLQLEPAEATIVLGASQTYTARGVAEDGTDLGDYTATASFATTLSSGSLADLIVDPRPRTLSGSGQREAFDDGQIRFPGADAVTVPLGELRTDDEGRLLVLGGFGSSASPSGKPIVGLTSSGWYDDVSDGPVTATVRLHGTSEELEAVGAWVLVGPPKFAPQLENVITLYDVVFQMGVDQGWHTRPDRPSYTNDIYPILQRARTMRWVIDVPRGRHTWRDPVYEQAPRQAIFGRLTDPTGGGGTDANMPLLNGATLTETQYAAMQAWKDGDFVRDWTAPPVPSPQVSPGELDVAALTGCVGASFAPGIEAGGFGPVPIVEPTRYLGADDPMRLDHAKVSPSDMTEHMALPWQADFAACGTGWWPVPRPSEVVPQGSATGEYVGWDRDVQSSEEMVAGWHSLGFVLRQGDRYLEIGHSPTTLITLLTPHLDFQDVPQGPMAMPQVTSLAIEFEVRSPGAAVTLEVEPGDGPGHRRLRVDPAVATVGPTVANEIATAQLWVSYETGEVDERIADQVTVRHAESGRTWAVTITANTVARQAAAVALVLDRPASPAADRGVGPPPTSAWPRRPRSSST